MPGKRKASSSYIARKRARMAFKRPRGRYGRSIKRRGQRFPTFKFHRYVNSITTYTFANGTTLFNDSSLPFTLYPGVCTGSAAGAVEWPISWGFCINDVASLSEFTSLFDRYMITGVQMSFQLVNNPNADDPRGSNIGGGATDSLGIYPKLWYAIDNDDTNIITLAALKEYGNVKCRILKPNSVIKIYVPFPKSTGSAFQTGGAQPAVANRPQWMDCAFPSIVHYGLKTCIDTNGIAVSSTSNPFRVKMEAKYYFRMKDVR